MFFNGHSESETISSETITLKCRLTALSDEKCHKYQFDLLEGAQNSADKTLVAKRPRTVPDRDKECRKPAKDFVSRSRRAHVCTAPPN